MPLIDVTEETIPIHNDDVARPDRAQRSCLPEVPANPSLN